MTATSAQLAARDRLITAGRAPMPENFEWDFGIPYKKQGCGSTGCMIGLAIEIGILPARLVRAHGNYGLALRLSRAIGIDDTDGCDLFLSSRRYLDDDGEPLLLRHVTPAMVADALAELPR